MWKWLTEKYLTWKTGISTEDRAYREWYDQTVVYRASTAEDMFKNFKHVITVDYQKIFIWWHPFGVPLVNDATQYFWPAKPTGECAVYRILRGEKDPYDNRFHITDFGGEDRVYVATNNSKDAMMIALKYA